MALVKIMRKDNIIYQGNILEMPIKDDYIVKKSIEVFDDDDPCIIHRSYIIKLIIDDFLEKTNLKRQKQINLTNFKMDLPYLDFNLEDSIIYYDE